MPHLNNAAKAAGVAAEQDARWYIDRTFHNSQNYRVLHDVLLFDSRSDAWCQIDHLVIGRLGHFLVLETKSAVQGMSLHAESGAWSVWFNGRPKPMKSPIAQNIRHIEVLGDYLRQHQIMPKRLFVVIPPSFENWILVQPGVRLPKEYGGARLVQRDQFSQEFDLFLKRMSDSSVLKFMTTPELDSIEQKLAGESRENKRVRGLSPTDPKAESAYAAPAPASYRVSEKTQPQPESNSDLRFAPPSEQRAQGFAHVASVIFEAASTLSTPAAAQSVRQKTTSCAKCGGELTAKEVSYCRFNFAKLGRRYLCRKCQ